MTLKEGTQYLLCIYNLLKPVTNKFAFVGLQDESQNLRMVYIYTVDHPCFGLSDGLHGYISKFDDLVDNVIEQYTKIKGMLCSYIIVLTLR